MTSIKGSIARLIGDKGFGFLKGADNVEYFFHRTAVQGASFDELRLGQAVEFEPASTTKGPRAGVVRLA